MKATKVKLPAVLYGGEQEEAIMYMCDSRYHLVYHRRRGASELRFLKHMAEERVAVGRGGRSK